MIENYIKDGYAVLNCPYDHEYINKLKIEINSLFKNDDDVLPHPTVAPWDNCGHG